MQTQHRAVRIFHHLVAHSGSLLDQRQVGCDNRRENAGSSMLQMRLDRSVKSLFGAVQEVIASTSMQIHGHETRHDVHAFRIHHFRSDHGQLTVGHLQYMPV